MLVMFIRSLITSITALMSPSAPIKWLREKFPSSLYLLRKTSGVGGAKLKEYVTGYGKRAHFAQELIFKNKQPKLVTPLDFVHNSDSVKCYNFSQEDQFLML